MGPTVPTVKDQLSQKLLPVENSSHDNEQDEINEQAKPSPRPEPREGYRAGCKRGDGNDPDHRDRALRSFSGAGSLALTAFSPSISHSSETAPIFASLGKSLVGTALARAPTYLL